MNIKIHIHKPGASVPQAIDIADEILIVDLLRQVVDGQHEEVDLFSEGRTEPHDRNHSVKQANINDGDKVYCKPREVRVHIDEERHLSQRVTTGAALYELGKVAAEHQLYRDVQGNREDEPIFRDVEIFNLEQDEHFHSSDKPFVGFHIIVNTEPKTVHKRLLSFDDVVELSGEPRPKGTDPETTVGYEDAAERHPDGTLLPAHFVKVKDGTIFHVAPTNRS